MNLLLSNDDGFDSEGLKVLADKLAQKHKVYIIAPSSNRSAVSHHITMKESNSLIKFSENIWSCSGYPVDCVLTGLESNILGVKIDAVISGINKGANMGTDIIYSGTCAVARQGVLSGVPSIAVSSDPIDWGTIDKEGFKFEALATFIADNLEKLISLARLDFPRAFVNVNALSTDSYKGAKIVQGLCRRAYGDKVAAIHDKDDKYHTEFIMGRNHTELLDYTDYGACRNGYIAVSVVYADPVGPESVDDMEFSV